MSAPWRWPEPAAVAAVLTCVGAPALAQLNLDRPAAPRPYEGAALLDLAQKLHGEIESRASRLAKLAGRERAAAEFSIAVRALSRVLLMKAEELGEPGSPHAVMGLTLALHADEIDHAAARLRDGGLPDEAAAAAAILAAQMTEQFGTVPARADDLDRWVRELLALPVHTGLLPAGDRPWDAEPWRAGWGHAGGTDTDLSAAAGRWTGVPAPTVEAVRRFDAEIVRPARAWWAYRGTADAVAGAIAAAGRVAEPGALPDWVPAPARDGLTARLSAAALSAIDPATRDAAMAGLADLALGAALLDKLERLSKAPGLPPSVRQRSIGPARAALLAAAAAGDSGRAALGLFDAALRLLGERAQLPGEESVLRDVRPAWRAMEAAARDAETELWEMLGRIGAGGVGGDPMDDPAVVGAVAGLRRALDDMAAVRAISAGLAGAGPGDAVVRNLAAQRVLRLGQDLSSPVRRATAAEVLRRFGTDLAELGAFPGEADLRTGGGPWADLTGGRAADLASRIDVARSAWLEAWVREREAASPSPAPGVDVPGAAEAADLRRLRRLVSAMHDCVLLRESARERGPGDALVDGGLGGINAWPGWELSARAAGSLERGARGPIERACKHVLAGDAAGAVAADAALREYEQGWAGVRLAAALQTRARERRVLWTPALVELAAPPPPGTTGWLAPLRGDLAAVCRYAEEHAHADAAGQVQRREALRAYLNERALAALERLAGAR